MTAMSVNSFETEPTRWTVPAVAATLSFGRARPKPRAQTTDFPSTSAMETAGRSFAAISERTNASIRATTGSSPARGGTASCARPELATGIKTHMHKTIRRIPTSRPDGPRPGQHTSDVGRPLPAVTASVAVGLVEGDRPENPDFAARLE